MISLLLALLLSLFASTVAPVGDATRPVVPNGAEQHDFHVSYSRLAVENTMAVVRIRVFKDDLDQALSQRENQPIVIDPSPRSDSLFQAYFNEKFVLRADEEVLDGRIVGSGEETIGNEPMWWYLLEFEASQPIENLYVSQKILSEVFDDQKNIVQVQHFPSEKTYSLYCVEDAWEYTVSFPED